MNKLETISNTFYVGSIILLGYTLGTLFYWSVIGITFKNPNFPAFVIWFGTIIGVIFFALVNYIDRELLENEY